MPFRQSAEDCSGRKAIPDSRPHYKIEETKNRKEKLKRKCEKSSFAFRQSAESCSGRKAIPDSRPHYKIEETKNRKEKLKRKCEKSSFAFCQSAEGCSGRKAIPDSRPLVNRTKQLFTFSILYCFVTSSAQHLIDCFSMSNYQFL